jgi:hypothetical protein
MIDGPMSRFKAGELGFPLVVKPRFSSGRVTLLAHARPWARSDETLGPRPSVRELLRGYRDTYRAERVHLDR